MMATFTQAARSLRNTLESHDHKDLARKLARIEMKYRRHGARIERHDAEIQAIFDAIRRLVEPAPRPRRRIGFKAADHEPITVQS